VEALLTAANLLITCRIINNRALYTPLSFENMVATGIFGNEPSRLSGRAFVFTGIHFTK